ncbi:tetratricopeptide repeat protein [Spirosoma luteolum]
MTKNRILILCLLAGFGMVRRVQAQALDGQQREALIQRAAAFRKQENYGMAIQQLDSILSKNPADAGIILFRGDLQLQNREFKKAVASYQQLIKLNHELTIARINLSYALFMDHHPAKALVYAAEAYARNSSNTNATVNYFNALLWNSRTTDAARFLATVSKNLSPAQRLVLNARLYTTSGNYAKGLANYDSLVRAFPDKNYVQEYAEVLLGKKEIARSETIMKTHDTLFTASEYGAFGQKLRATRMQNAGAEFVLFSDVAKNTRLESSIWYQQGEGRRFRFRYSAGVSTITSAENTRTSAQFGHITVNERFGLAWSGQSDVHLQVIKPEGKDAFSGITGRQTIQYQPNDRRMIGLVYNSEILNYTARLLGSNVRSHNLGYVTHILLSGRTGIFSQGSAGVLTDQNQRYLFFGSLYHLLRTEPTVKVGLNFSALHFSNPAITAYFSPDRYLSTELFADYSTALPHLARHYFQLQAAGGAQQIERLAWEPAFRLQAELGYRSNHFETGLKYQTSNVASSAGTGYKFNWFTYRLLWKW